MWSLLFALKSCSLFIFITTNKFVMRKTTILCLTLICSLQYYSSAQDSYDKHPNTSGDGWTDLFNAILAMQFLKKVCGP